MNINLSKWQEEYPDKFVSEKIIFNSIERGNKIFISTGCGEPQYLVNALIKYIESNPKAFADTEVYHIWTLGLAPYIDEKFTYNFRHNSFFISQHSRGSVNSGLADYTPIFLSQIPGLIRRRLVHFDVALIQTSLPDKNGFVSLGISVDIAKAAILNAPIVVAQVNSNMPRVHGDSFISIKDINYLVHHDEPLLEYSPKVSDNIRNQIGKYASQIIMDGDTIQVGYGRMPNAILENLKDKKNLGIHTELMTDAVVDLMEKGVIDNSRKTIDRGKTVATFCMGTKKSYEYIDDNPQVEFKTVDYTNNPLIIAQNKNMTSINSALQIDLTGQATVESIGTTFFSGIGGSADFMRGALLARGGKTILVIKSTAKKGTLSRIVPSLERGTGVTLNRGDVHYVVTEHGIAYIHGKNIRERTMDLISISHPKFRSWLIEEAKKLNLIYKDQAFVSGENGIYPEHLETYKTTKTGLTIFIRPVRINDEPLVKEFFYSLSDDSLYKRFFTRRLNIPHEMRQDFFVIDYSKEISLLATIRDKHREVIIGMAQYKKIENMQMADLAVAVRDDCQRGGVGTVLLSYLAMNAARDGLHGFIIEVLAENKAMMKILEKTDFDIQKKLEGGCYEVQLRFSNLKDQ